MPNPPNIDIEKYKISPENGVELYSGLYSECEEEQPSEQAVLNKMRGFIKKLDKQFKENNILKNEKYREECFSIIPKRMWVHVEKKDLADFQRLTTYDSLNETLVIKIHNYAGDLISYKRRRAFGGKWITAKGTHPNKTPLVRFNKSYGDVLICCEGHHDYLSAVLCGFNVMSVPTVSYSSFTESDMASIFQNRVIFMPDLGDQGKSIKSQKALRDQIKGACPAVSMINLKKFIFMTKGISSKKDKYDFSELVEEWPGDLAELRVAISSYAFPGE